MQESSIGIYFFCLHKKKKKKHDIYANTKHEIVSHLINVRWHLGKNKKNKKNYKYMLQKFCKKKPNLFPIKNVYARQHPRYEWIPLQLTLLKYLPICAIYNLLSKIFKECLNFGFKIVTCSFCATKLSHVTHACVVCFWACHVINSNSFCMGNSCL